jgi:ATP/maltotriose-dependent transcriptional regulator MalT
MTRLWRDGNGHVWYGTILVDMETSQGSLEPSAMSELAGWIRGNGTSNYWYCDYEAKPEKVSWLQKLKKYDDLQARCDAAEAMRDHYKESYDSWMQVVLVKSRELKLMERVAEVWQDRLREANARIAELEKEIGSDNSTEEIPF